MTTFYTPMVIQLTYASTEPVAYEPTYILLPARLLCVEYAVRGAPPVGLFPNEAKQYGADVYVYGSVTRTSLYPDPVWEIVSRPQQT